MADGFSRPERSPRSLMPRCLARITRRKGHHLTLAALSRLPDDLRHRITWLVIGPDGEADYVGELRRAAGQAAFDIRFLGPQPNETIRDLYAASDFFCLTGLPDTTGRVVARSTA